MTQHMEALKKANKTRLEMKAIKSGIRCGDYDPVDVILDCTLPIKAVDVLLSIMGVGITKARKFLKTAHLSDLHTLGGTRSHGHLPMTEEQRIRLIEVAGWQASSYRRSRARRLEVAA